jgi:hypothetical protein
VFVQHGLHGGPQQSANDKLCWLLFFMTRPAGPVQPLAPARLYRAADLSALPFQSTADIAAAGALIGQDRAVDAIDFGVRVDRPGFNLFVIGPNGMRAQHAVAHILKETAGERRIPPDWNSPALPAGNSMATGLRGSLKLLTGQRKDRGLLRHLPKARAHRQPWRAYPTGNVQHLMLRRDVIDACSAGRFFVYPVAIIDE